MGIFLVVLSAIMWSFVPILVKSSALMVDPFTITFSRFFFGVLLLIMILLIRQGRLQIGWKEKWIWYGALGKSVNYIFENLGITIGYAFAQVMVMPMMMVYMMLASLILFKEKLNRYSAVAGILAVSGVLMLSWNGMPLEQLLELNVLVTGLFALSALGGCFHFISQKILIEKMSSGQMNVSVFFWATLITAVPLPLMSETTAAGFSIGPMLSLIALGTITAVSFFIYGIGVKKVSFMAASILVNAGVLFTILWSYLFLDEPITGYTWFGTLLFLCGMVLINVPAFQASRAQRIQRNH